MNGIPSGSKNNVYFGSRNNVRGSSWPAPAGLAAWVINWPFFDCSYGTPFGAGYNAWFNPPFPGAGITTPFAGINVITPMTIASPPGGGHGAGSQVYNAEYWSGTPTGASIGNPGANPTVLFIYAPGGTPGASAAGKWRMNFNITNCEFPRSLGSGPAMIQAYVSLVNTGAGLMQVGKPSGADITLAVNTAFPPAVIPTDSANFDYRFDSVRVLGSSSNFYQYLLFTGLPTQDAFNNCAPVWTAYGPY